MKHRITGLPEVLTTEIGQLAISLHQQRGELLVAEFNSPLSSVPPHSNFWSTKDRQIQFSSIEVRNECVAIHTFREKVQHSDERSSSELFDIAYELWRHEIGHSDFASGRFLALVSDKTNVLAVAAELITTGKWQVFNALHLVEAALKYLPEIEVEDLCAFIAAQHAKTERDLARGMIFAAIEKTLSERPVLALDLYEHLKFNITTATMNLASSALLGLALAGEVDDAAQKALRDSTSKNPLTASISLWVIARLLSSFTLLIETQEKCLGTLREHSQNPIKQTRISATQAIAHAAKAHPTLYLDLLNQAQSLEKEALAITTEHLYLNSGSLENLEKFPEFIDALIHVTPDMTAVLSNIDWILSRLLLAGSHHNLVLRFLKTWITINGNSLPRDKESVAIFDQTFMELAQKPELLQKLITEWLIAEETQLPAACAGLISFLWVRGHREPQFSSVILDGMDSDELILLVRRMLGFVLSEEALLSLTFSLLNTQNSAARTHDLVHTLLTQEIGRDYPHDTLEKIKSRTETAPPELKKVLDSAFAKLSHYMNAISDLPVRQELRPPPQLRRAIALRRSAEMRKAMGEVNEQSVLLKLAKQVQLKAGIGWFSVDNGSVGETHHLHSMSQSVNLPRRYLSDPVGYEIQGLLFRIAKRGEK